MAPTIAARQRSPEIAKSSTLLVAGGLAVCTALLLVIIFGGDYTARVREFLGISRFMAEKQGLYADCLRSNPNGNRYCAERMGVDQRLRAQQQPKFSSSPKDFIPFSLHDR